MTDPRDEALRIALEDYQTNGAPFLKCDSAIAAIRAALENRPTIKESLTVAAPPQRKPLTSNEIERIYDAWDAMPYSTIADLVRLVERAHGITENKA